MEDIQTVPIHWKEFCYYESLAFSTDESLYELLNFTLKGFKNDRYLDNPGLYVFFIVDYKDRVKKILYVGESCDSPIRHKIAKPHIFKDSNGKEHDIYSEMLNEIITKYYDQNIIVLVGNLIGNYSEEEGKELIKAAKDCLVHYIKPVFNKKNESYQKKINIVNGGSFLLKKEYM
ncbi:hypothetical protein [Treponema putidum]|uniref:hypothetical protein n=1 Tax=Treponema putidum TaxID=221027 RepID=UPI003D90D03E